MWRYVAATKTKDPAAVAARKTIDGLIDAYPNYIYLKEVSTAAYFANAVEIYTDHPELCAVLTNMGFQRHSDLHRRQVVLKPKKFAPIIDPWADGRERYGYWTTTWTTV